MAILRTNPYWRFARKNQKVGQNHNFRCRKWRFFGKKIFESPYLAPRCP